MRLLREAQGKTQLDVELDANLGSGYLQRVESGKVKQPERETLERILLALGARYTERRDILELFGYIVRTSLPTEDETGWAIRTSQPILEGTPFPAYLLDCAHRLLVWNAYTPRLFGREAPGSMARLANVSMLAILFDSQYGFAQLIHNPEAFYPATLQALRYEMRQFSDETWYEDVLNAVMQIPLFQRYWTATQAEPLQPAAARPLTPIEFDIPSAGVLGFRLTSEVLSEDRRFRIIYYLPADSATMRQCAEGSTGDHAQRPGGTRH